MGVPLPTVSLRKRTARLGRTGAAFAFALGPVQVRRLARRPVPEGATVRALRDAFGQLGATYVKLGQFLAASPGLVGADVAAEFRGCLDDAPAVPFEAVRGVVESELGRPLADVFDEFEAEPLAAASIAVVHRARLRDGTDVAVKVLRPGIEATVAADLSTMQALLRFLARQGIGPAAGGLQFVTGLAAQLAEELDLRNEAGAMERFRLLFSEAGLDLLVVPEVHFGLSGRRVLTMSLLEGAAVDDLARVADLGVDPRPLVEQLLRSWYLGIVRDGVFHGDVHAGNLLVLPDGRLGVLDWGIVARLDADTHAAYRRMVEGCLGDESAWLDIARYVLKLMPDWPDDLTPEQMAPGLRTQIEHTLTRPLGEGGISLVPTPTTGAAEIDDPFWASFRRGRERPNTIRARVAAGRQARLAARRILDGGGIDTAFNRSNLLTLKTVVYLEQYGKLYVPDLALLSDEAFLRVLLG